MGLPFKSAYHTMELYMYIGAMNMDVHEAAKHATTKSLTLGVHVQEGYCSCLVCVSVCLSVCLLPL